VRIFKCVLCRPLLLHRRSRPSRPSLRFSVTVNIYVPSGPSWHRGTHSDSRRWTRAATGAWTRRRSCASTTPSAHSEDSPIRRVGARAPVSRRSAGATLTTDDGPPARPGATQSEGYASIRAGRPLVDAVTDLITCERKGLISGYNV
jgi:hypothetical protein